MALKQLIHVITLAGLLVLLPACAPMTQTGRAPVYTSSPSRGGESVSRGSESVRESAPERPTYVELESETPLVIAATDPGQTGPAQKAVQGLLDEAWTHYRNNDPDKAIAVAERAQRLNDRSAEVYLVLASSYLVQGKQEIAEQFARRGLSYSSVGSTLRNRLQQLLGQM
jgi:Flp pilus assembly protein TadD